MKVFILFFLILTTISLSKIVENDGDIILKPPQTMGGMPLYEAVKKRRSKREFNFDDPISDDLLSQALWVCNGINESPDKRTIPASKGYYSLIDYVFLKSGVYVYDYNNHILRKYLDGDHRSVVSAKDIKKIGKASFKLCQIVDYEYPGFYYEFNRETKKKIAGYNAGYCAYNLALLGAHYGIQNVPIGGFNNTKILNELDLNGKRNEVILCFALGFEE